MTRDEGAKSGSAQTPIQEKYQPPAAGAASNTGTGGSGVGHPSSDPDQQASEDSRGGGTAAPRSSTEHQPLGEGQGGSGRGDDSRDLGARSLGTGLAESYDAAPPPQGGSPATGGSGQEPKKDVGAQQDKGGK
jgi:hypothetical protein